MSQEQELLALAMSWMEDAGISLGASIIALQRGDRSLAFASEEKAEALRRCAKELSAFIPELKTLNPRRAA